MNIFISSIRPGKIGNRLLLLFVAGVCLACNLFGQPYPYKIKRTKDAPKGFYLLTTFKVSNLNYGEEGSVMILDGEGNTVLFQKIEKCNDFRVLPNRLFSYHANDKFYLLDQRFAIVDSVECVKGIHTDFHDFRLLPNGNFLLLGSETINMDLSPYASLLPKDGNGNAKSKVYSGVVQELDKNRRVVYEWRAKDHFHFDDVDFFFLNDKDTTAVDWTHFNSIEQDRDGNYLLSSKNFCEVTKISRRDSSVIWRWGGKRNQFTFTGDTIPFLIQHDVRRLKNGHITLFDNGFADKERNHYARALEYELDEKQKKATLYWQYFRKPVVHTPAQGNVQRLKKGYTLVNFGKAKSENLMFEVVKKSGEKVFEISFDDSLGTYRAYHYKKLPLRILRPEIRNVWKNDRLFLDAGEGYPAYLWSTGDTTRQVCPTKEGYYQVYVPCGEGAYISSRTFKVTSGQLNKH